MMAGKSASMGRIWFKSRALGGKVADCLANYLANYLADSRKLKNSLSVERTRMESLSSTCL